MKKRIPALFLIISIALGIAASASDYATRGEVADFLLSAADFYNPGVVRSDIIKGYEDGLLHEDRTITRAEALVMLKRAFGNLPAPAGHNKRTSLTAENFYDIPAWAEDELSNVFNAGIVAGTGENTFSPDLNVTMTQMNLFVKRVYSLYGKNPKDDFYATVNKEYLENMTIPKGEYVHGTIYDIQTKVSTQLDRILKNIVSGKHTNGTPDQKLADLYKCIVDTKAIDKDSVKPIKAYLEKIDSVKNIGELSMLQTELSAELCVNPFVGFTLVVDYEKGNEYALNFYTASPLMSKEIYSDENIAGRDAYIKYIETLLNVGGESLGTAMKNARNYYEFEKQLAENMLTPDEQTDIEKIYNVYTYNKLEAMFPDFNLDEVATANYLEKKDTAIVTDTGIVKKFSEMYNQSNLDVLKTVAKVAVLNTWGKTLDTRIEKVYYELENTIFGSEGTYTREQTATVVLFDTMPEYLGKLYVEKYFEEESKKDVTKMVDDIREVFKERIKSLSWMSEKTKEKAVKKLDSMRINIGYPESFSSFIDDVEIIPPEKGGTYFKNMLAIMKAYNKMKTQFQNAGVDYSQWAISPYTVNAGYDLTGNIMTFPAAILQAPLYDKDAAYEENLGGIGYIIAHEMTHAFDSNGARFDENGNLADWWEEEDYAAFRKICDKVVSFYDGYEAIPAVPTNGQLTLSENVADLGAAACIVELAGKNENPDYKKLFTAMANTFMNTYSREYAIYASINDPHADGKARANCVVVHFEEFYEAFDVKKGDGMYLSPEERIRIW